MLPEIFTKNYIDSQSDLVASGNTEMLPNIYDDNEDTYWESAINAPADDSYSIYVQSDFLVDGETIARDIDRIFIQDHNLKKFKIYYWIDANPTWQQIYSTTTNTTTNTLITVAPEYPPEKIKITIDDTISTGQKAVITGLYAFKFSYYLQDVLTPAGHNRRDYEKEDSYRLSSGTLENWRIRRTRKYALRDRIINVNNTVRNNLYTTHRQKQTFCFAPNRDIWTNLISNVKWAGPWTTNYNDKTGLWQIDLDFQGV